VDSWHTLWILRPLIILVMATPTLIIPVLLGLRKKRPDAEVTTETHADGAPRYRLSAPGWWRTDADSGYQSVASGEAESSAQKRAA
jgi:hypothetical protein